MLPKRQNKYVDLKTNGKLFPSWVLKNFSKYKLPEIMSHGEDPCNRKEGKQEARKYQMFLTKYLDYNSPFRDVLIYHGLGSGKTVSAINIYNMLYNYTSGWNVYIVIKAALKDQPWMKDLERWLDEERDNKMKNIQFISYDSPIADKQFLEAVKNSDITKKNMYIFDEVHNFIRNVYTNINSGKGKRAQVIYDYITNDKKENEGVRVILLSGTPAINNPFELALLFNLLRPGTFPKSETTFNQIYINNSTYPKINDANKNMFQRRILGLVSYYIGATPDLYASKKIYYVDCPMSDYQKDIYNYYEELEEKMEKQQSKKKSKKSSTYKTYTRQASNFVFPQINQWITAELRPRPNKFNITEKEIELLEHDQLNLENPNKSSQAKKYMNEIDKFTDAFDNYLDNKHKQDIINNYTILDDIKLYLEKYKTFADFLSNNQPKSLLFTAMSDCSNKMLNMIFNILISPGPVQIYSNYVLLEGLQIFKVYLKHFGFSSYKSKQEGEPNFRYTEFHGRLEPAIRKLNLDAFNHPDNKYGNLIKIIMISPAGAEGISLQNTVQVHIMEPHWNEVRITQMIGRALRQCSHKDLPLKERHVDIFRYKSIRLNKDKIKYVKPTADEFVEQNALSKDGLIQSFLDTIKEAAIDCVLYKAHNMMEKEYKCFQFAEPSLFNDQVGPAYKQDINDDSRFNNGLNDMNSISTKIKVMKINAVILMNPLTQGQDMSEAKYSISRQYWYSHDSRVVYDFDLHYAIGKVGIDEDGPLKLNKDTYIITQLISIPLVD